LPVAFSNLENPDGFIGRWRQCRACLEAEASAVSRADHDAAGSRSITFELGTREWLPVVSASIFEGMKFAV
jgi:hypothetical protein